MSVNLTVASPISGSPIQVSDQEENNSALYLAARGVEVIGGDIVGSPMPLVIIDQTSASDYENGITWGRLTRLQDDGTSNTFYDIGIDVNGTLFINSPASTASTHILTLTGDGVLSVNTLAINQLRVTGLLIAPPGVPTANVVVDPATGTLYREN
jgi:hypothetical protein